MSLRITSDGEGGSIVAVKAVPGASRDEVAGVLGDRLKVRVSAAAERGKANKAICAVIAEALAGRGAPGAQVEILSGHGSAAKQVRVRRIEPARLAALLEGA